MPPKRGGTRRVRPGSRKKRVRFYAYGRTGILGQRTMGRRRSTVRGRKRRGGYRKRSASTKRRKLYKRRKARSFRTQLTKAQGISTTFTRNIQSQFLIPISQERTIAGIVEQPEPMAHYMYPRDRESTESTAYMYGPLCTEDWNLIMLQCLPTFAVGANSSLYKIALLIAYQARYQVINQTNVAVHYEAYVFRVKKSVPLTSQVGISYDYRNPLNVAGNYLTRTQDLGPGDNNNADSIALHTERVHFEKMPPIREYFKLIKKSKFTLQPGKMKTHYIKSKQRKYRIIENYPTVVVLETGIPVQYQCWWKGTTFIVYKSLSSPADILSDGETNYLTKFSTRTTPASLVSYQCNYHVLKPALAEEQLDMVHINLPTIGYRAAVNETAISAMGLTTLTALPQVKAQ